MLICPGYKVNHEIIVTTVLAVQICAISNMIFERKLVSDLEDYLLLSFLGLYIFSSHATLREGSSWYDGLFIHTAFIYTVYIYIDSCQNMYVKHD